MQTLPKCGITVKQYGKFHVREIRSDGTSHLPGLLQISLEEDKATEMFIGYIPCQNSDLVNVKQRIRFWIMEQKSQLNQVDQWINDVCDLQTQEKLYALNAVLEEHLKKIQQALRAIDDHQ
ncbi:hypothetical protein KDI_45840 [Dictyobacter arantiisoli]|uniref:Uncharacterized protein n=2 Tax=Dictyobacter arantiisoli TaxID=2014874 RepID=A0A5A5THG7_9CHLR|nr:hypothetical protein KDI_45840 [Dictyobacter arantiisoli]